MLPPASRAVLAPDTRRPDANVQAVLDDVASRLSTLKARIDHELSSPGQLRSACLEASGYVEQARKQLAEQTAKPDEAAILTTSSTDSIALRPNDDHEALVGVFMRYDGYFGVSRTSAGQSADRFASILGTVAAVLADIGNCSIDIHEFSAIVDAMSAVGTTGGSSSTDSPAHASAATHSEGVEAEALYRWKLGHHLFNAFTMLASESLQRVAENDDAPTIVGSLNTARTLLRGTTAAMWYAEAFPTALYAEHVRPSMVEATGTGSGFSGTDNLEFRYFNARFDAAINSLRERFGDPSEWPHEIRDAAYDLADMRVLDLEHHTLLAEKVVGREISLKQDRLRQKAAGKKLLEQPAIEALRGIGERVKTVRDAL